MHRDVLGDMYGAVETLMNWVKFNGVRVSVVFFADRYQNPFKGGYKDLLCLIRVNGYVCELQLNIDDMLEIKEGAGHKQYELERKVNDELIHAAMKGDVKKVRLSLDSSANPNASRDMYNLESLHYAK